VSDGDPERRERKKTTRGRRLRVPVDEVPRQSAVPNVPVEAMLDDGDLEEIGSTPPAAPPAAPPAPRHVEQPAAQAAPMPPAPRAEVATPPPIDRPAVAHASSVVVQRSMVITSAPTAPTTPIAPVSVPPMRMPTFTSAPVEELPPLDVDTTTPGVTEAALERTTDPGEPEALQAGFAEESSTEITIEESADADDFAGLDDFDDGSDFDELQGEATTVRAPLEDELEAAQQQQPSHPPTAHPLSQPSTAHPASQPPTARPASQPPTARPASQPPTAHPASQPPTAHPASQPPTARRASQPPTAHPASQPPTARRASQPPTAHPASQPPTAHPASQPPTARHASQPPTARPLSQPPAALARPLSQPPAALASPDGDLSDALAAFDEITAVASLAADDAPAEAAVEVASSRDSSPPEELASDDLATEELAAEDLAVERLAALARPAPPPAPPGAAMRPPPAPPATPSASRITPPATPIALAATPAGAAAEVAEQPKRKKRAKVWWEEFFNDDYLRTVRPPKQEQVVRQCNFLEYSLGLQKGATILDVGCGLGLQAVELAARGYVVVGLDLSLPMLSRAADEAQDREIKMNFLHGDMREMSFDGAFDAVLCVGTTFGYFDDDTNRQVLDRMKRALKPHGLLMLDVVNRDFVVQGQPNLVWFEGDGCICMEETQFNYITSRLHVKRTVILEDGRQRENEYSIRLYPLHEVGQVMHQMGFRVAEVSGMEATPGVYFGATSPRLIILAEKRVERSSGVMQAVTPGATPAPSRPSEPAPPPTPPNDGATGGSSGSAPTGGDDGASS